MNHARLMWGSIAAFGVLAGGKAAMTVRTAPGLPVVDVLAALAALIVVGGSVLALRHPERFEPASPWLAYLAAAGTLAYAALVVV
ncbi:MAG: hypothetical protein ABEJ81_03795 [Haloferacaceae archaeon]